MQGEVGGTPRPSHKKEGDRGQETGAEKSGKHKVITRKGQDKKPNLNRPVAHLP